MRGLNSQYGIEVVLKQVQQKTLGYIAVLIFSRVYGYLGIWVKLEV